MRVNYLAAALALSCASPAIAASPAYEVVKICNKASLAYGVGANPYLRITSVSFRQGTQTQTQTINLGLLSQPNCDYVRVNPALGSSVVVSFSGFYNGFAGGFGTVTLPPTNLTGYQAIKFWNSSYPGQIEARFSPGSNIPATISAPVVPVPAAQANLDD